MTEATPPLRIARFFVDEAGDLNLFDRKGRVLLGREGVSNYSAAPDFRLIMDLNDTRRKPYGEWYSDRNPLTPEKIFAL